ncbi:hypothetical protein B0H14DRAFT_2796114 [Mycena olivaceomarginata]|nr:hypothetical protein B0H14DRAFT_2796114 [Mycena olivaceomarginata]
MPTTVLPDNEEHNTCDAKVVIPSPISRLPPEILADIFVRCVPVSIGRLRTSLIWLNIPKVSTLWRDVALGCPEFWSTLVVLRPKWMPVFLARSKTVPLVVRADVRKLDASGGQRLDTILLDNISRLGTLEVRSPQGYIVGFLYGDLEYAGAAPQLQSLKVVNTDEFGDGLWLPMDLFRRSKTVEESDKARTQSDLCLHLEGCAFPWDSAWYSHLTHLHLENINSVKRPTMETLLTILVGSPALQTLTLIHCYTFTPTCTDLLKCLILPPSATFNISYNIKTFHETDTSVASLITDFSRTSRTMYDTVRIIHKDGFVYSLLDSARPWWSRRFKIEGKSCQPYPSLCDATRALLNALDFSTVTTLHLHACANTTTGALWAAFAHRLHRVRTLHLHRTVPAEFLDFLLTQAMFVLGLTHWNYEAYGLGARGPDGRPVHAWAGLQRICLHGIDLGEMLRALLWARREGGARIWQVEIEECENVLSGDLRHLRVFADVVYDGKGHKVVENDEGYASLRAYSIGVLARMVERDEEYVE